MDPKGRLRTGAIALGLVGLLVACTGSPAPDAEGPSGPSAQQAASPSAETSFTDVVAAVEERVSTYDDIATGVVALVRVGDRTEVVTAGTSQVARDEPTRAGQSFPIASITKPMTATLVLQLVQEGRLALDDLARRWLPELGPAGREITVEHLLSHRSGLSETVEADVRRVGLADTAALVARSAARPLDFPPGTEGSYSNIGYGALGLLAQRVLDQPLDAALDARVFRPAGMTGSSLGGRPDVQGYDQDGRPVEDYYLEFVPAAGSVVSPVASVDAFFRALWAGRLVTPRIVEQMREPRGRLQYWRDYGLGLAVEEFTCGRAFGHSGRIGGFTDEAWTLEDGERSTVVMINDESADTVARSIVETALCS